VLVIVLVINAAMFFVEFGAGLVAGSAALMADATDMLADAFVFGLSLYAVARSDRWKAGVAAFKGALILVLGLGILVNVAVKIQSGVPPSSSLMLIFGGAALVANLVSVVLLWRFRAQDVNMASTYECSRNDVISNVGVLIAAGLVAGTSSPWPDIGIGLAMAAIVLRSSVRVLSDSVPHLKSGPAGATDRAL
jgi:cation diffusion facilitator family transporter